MAKNDLTIRNVAENNLKNLNLELPHDSIIAVTGLSGSGKSSLAFETVYAEGQRRYVETFSTYTRQFFDKTKKPTADQIQYVRPAVAIQQKTRIKNSRSTVGSLTNLNEYLRILWCNFARPICPSCVAPLKGWSPASLLEHFTELAKLFPDSSFYLCAGIPTTKKELAANTEKLTILGYTRWYDPNKDLLHQFEDDAPKPKSLLFGERLLLVIDRFKAKRVKIEQLRDSIDQCWKLGENRLYLVRVTQQQRYRPFRRVISSEHQPNLTPPKQQISMYSKQAICEFHDVQLPKPTPALFSFNSPQGACEECKGFGSILTIDPDKCVPNPELSIKEKALLCWSTDKTRKQHRELVQFCSEKGIPTDKPWKKLSADQKEEIFFGSGKKYKGVFIWFKKLERKLYKMHVRVFISKFRSESPCPECGGKRLNINARSFRVNGLAIDELFSMPIQTLLEWVTALPDGAHSTELIEVRKAIVNRLQYLIDLGLGYLTLDRQSKTLSGGETQRVNLTTALGSGLSSTQFVLDEPSVGLHPRDSERLIRSVHKLCSSQNSILLVEHDLDCIRSAEHVLELGPGAGEQGGNVCYMGSAHAWKGDDDYELRPSKRKRRKFSPGVKIEAASVRNLKNLSVTFPDNALIAVTGVSGSGKSTLVEEVLFRHSQALQGVLPPEKDLYKVTGLENYDCVEFVDQSPLAKSPRANIATYTKVWDIVRDTFANTDAALQRGLTKSSFSFNVDNGRCTHCKGCGFIKEDLQFLSDVHVVCEQCLGKRFQPELLQVTLEGKSIHDILQITIVELAELFPDDLKIQRVMETLSQLGLAHLRLGHSLSELSGGEAQRLKLSPYLSAKHKKKTLFLFDEPTTGLHFRDVQGLVELFQSLVAQGHTVICVEHNLQLIHQSDWVIDIGPDGGEKGGEVVFEGEPSALALKKAQKTSLTSRYYSAHLNKESALLKKSTKKKPSNELVIIGAKENNLKEIDVKIPLNKTVAICGVSGSGKSTLAKDIIYAEGQRRYLDCLSPYARQFIREMKRPDVSQIENIQPTICVHQHTYQPSKLSTVATMSEIYNFLRLLVSKLGTQYCPDHPSSPVEPLSSKSMAGLIRKDFSGSIRILAPIINEKKGLHKPIFSRAISAEITEVRVDSVIGKPSLFVEGLERNKAHTIEYVVAKCSLKNIDDELLREAIEQALLLGSGSVIVLGGRGKEKTYSTERACQTCHRGFLKPDPEDLSFNSRRGKCQKCSGSGRSVSGKACKSCGGTRLSANGRNVRLQGETIAEISAKTPPELESYISQLELADHQQAVAEPIISEILSRSKILSQFGLSYLSLDRSCVSLSNGELQRLRLAAAMGSPLSGALYIFDEPSVGLHPIDNARVIEHFHSLVERENSVIVVEHDPQTLLSCEHVIEIGPGGGSEGGRLIYNGSREKFAQMNNTPTSRALHTTTEPRDAKILLDEEKPYLSVHGASVNNLKKLDVDIPLKSLVTLAGVSGAGKSSLLHSVIEEAVGTGDSEVLYWDSEHAAIESDIPIERCISIDQSPIGRTSRSTPASYLKVWDEVRKLFASSIEAKSAGWSPSFFSYNTGEGRCQECKGVGYVKLEMSFLADAKTECQSCYGSRFGPEANSVFYNGLRPSDVLDLTFAEAGKAFAAHRKINSICKHVCNLGLGYLTLGQHSSSLSGGECQRLKLVSELSMRHTKHTLYLLDEPTTGLHRSDVKLLANMLRSLVDRGNSVFIIEHDDEMILSSDFVLELGPGPSEEGGELVFSGTAEELLLADSPWGETLRKSSHNQAA